MFRIATYSNGKLVGVNNSRTVEAAAKTLARELANTRREFPGTVVLGTVGGARRMTLWEATERVQWTQWLYRTWNTETPISGDDLAGVECFEDGQPGGRWLWNLVRA